MRPMFQRAEQIVTPAPTEKYLRENFNLDYERKYITKKEKTSLLGDLALHFGLDVIDGDDYQDDTDYDCQCKEVGPTALRQALIDLSDSSFLSDPDVKIELVGSSETYVPVTGTKFAGLFNFIAVKEVQVQETDEQVLVRLKKKEWARRKEEKLNALKLAEEVKERLLAEKQAIAKNKALLKAVPAPIVKPVQKIQPAPLVTGRIKPRPPVVKSTVKIKRKVAKVTVRRAR